MGYGSYSSLCRPLLKEVAPYADACAKTGVFPCQADLLAPAHLRCWLNPLGEIASIAYGRDRLYSRLSW
jgi:hypothetical protein